MKATCPCGAVLDIPDERDRDCAAEDTLDAVREDDHVVLNCFGELYELPPIEAEELGTQLIYAAARARGK